jgi:hypothetical protein
VGKSSQIVLPVKLALRILACLTLSLGASGGFAQPHSLKSEVAFYLDTYGEVTPEQDVEVATAHRVFAALRSVADMSNRRLPKLVVVRSHADPWAIALPSGHIVLSREAISICHREASAGMAEARLAFVLGHELAHLAHDDFWHQEVYAFLSQHDGTQALARFLQSQESSQDQELKADDKGFMYASIAGYAMETLLKSGASDSDFFNFWLAQTSARVQSAHLAADIRAERHRQHLLQVQEQLALFHFGVRLAHFDYCDDAVYFFREFLKVYPGREVLNNLGYCQLQMARQEMDPGHAYFYWMPLLLDADVRAAPAASRSAELSLKTLRQAGLGSAEAYLRDAVTYLKQAVQADPLYLPAHLQLAIAYLYLGQPQQARAALEEPGQQFPEDAQLQMLDALALYEQSDSGLDLWPAALAKLEKLAASQNVAPEVLFNLARLTSVRPRPVAAQGLWNRLLEDARQLPAPILPIVCQAQAQKTLSQEACLRPQAATVSTQPLPWIWPVANPGFKPIREPLLPDWKSIEFDWARDKLHGHIHLRPDGLAEVLELDHFVHMQVLRGEYLGRIELLPRYCAEPLRHRVLAHGEVWTCDHWAAWVREDRLQEVWWVAK